MQHVHRLAWSMGLTSVKRTTGTGLVVPTKRVTLPREPLTRPALPFRLCSSITWAPTFSCRQLLTCRVQGLGFRIYGPGFRIRLSQHTGPHARLRCEPTAVGALPGRLL